MNRVITIKQIIVMINSKHGKSFYGKAKIFMINQKTKEAFDCLKNAIELDPVIKSHFVRDYPEIRSSKFFSSLIDESK